jgi:phosphodiesterase/alkaline phosphatase D-like protein
MQVALGIETFAPNGPLTHEEAAGTRAASMTPDRGRAILRAFPRMTTPPFPPLNRRRFLRACAGAAAAVTVGWQKLRAQAAALTPTPKPKVPPRPAQPPTVWAGGVTAEGAVVKARVPQPGRARLLVSDGRLATPLAYPAVPAAAADAAVATFPLTGLRPNTAYRYVLEWEGKPVPQFAGQFRTFPSGPASFAFAFASCARTGSSHPVFAAIQRRAPLFFLHLGDLHYEDIGRNDPAIFRAAYDAVFGSPAQAALYRSTPFAYVWDDHDFGPNGSDGRSPSRAAARQAYREYIPHYPLGAGSGDAAIHQAFSVGRVRFIVLDCRSERIRPKAADGLRATMLGAAQRAWLEQELVAAGRSAALVFLVSSVPWIGSEKEKPGDSWAAYPDERAQVAGLIRRAGLAGKVCVLCGDAHMLAADSGRNSDYAPGGGVAMPVLHGSSLDRNASRKGGPYSEGTYLPKKGEGCFGWVEVRDDGARIAVQFSGRNHLDETRVKLEFTV